MAQFDASSGSAVLLIGIGIGTTINSLSFDGKTYSAVDIGDNSLYQTVAIPRLRFSLSSTTTVYLNTVAKYTTVPNGHFSISARRVR